MARRKRFLIYSLLGITFGVADWHYLDLLAYAQWGTLQNQAWMVWVVIALNVGVWLLPLLPVALHESRVSLSAKSAALAGALCWSSSILGYYLYYTALLASGRLPHMTHLNIFQEWSAGFWQGWSAAFQKIILQQVIEWLPVSIVGGALLGLCVGWVWVRTRKAR